MSNIEAIKDQINIILDSLAKELTQIQPTARDNPSDYLAIYLQQEKLKEILQYIAFYQRSIESDKRFFSIYFGLFNGYKSTLDNIFINLPEDPSQNLGAYLNELDLIFSKELDDKIFDIAVMQIAIAATLCVGGLTLFILGLLLTNFHFMPAAAMTPLLVIGLVMYFLVIPYGGHIKEPNGVFKQKQDLISQSSPDRAIKKEIEITTTKEDGCNVTEPVTLSNKYSNLRDHFFKTEHQTNSSICMKIQNTLEIPTMN